MADTIQAIASIVNLIIVVAFFIVERKALVHNMRQERREYWYRETLLNRCLRTVEECFDELDALIYRVSEFYPYQKPDAEKQIRNIISSIKKQISLIKKVLNIYTKLFDKNLYRRIRVLLENLEDTLTSNIEQNYYAEIACDNLSYELASYRYKLLYNLYQFDTLQEK